MPDAERNYPRKCPAIKLGCRKQRPKSKEGKLFVSHSYVQFLSQLAWPNVHDGASPGSEREFLAQLTGESSRKMKTARRCYSVPFKREASESPRICPNCVWSSRGRANAGRHPRCRPFPRSRQLSRDLARSSVTSATYETDGPSVGDSEKATGRRG